MRSTPKKLIMAALLAIGAAGCAEKAYQPTVQKLSPAPIVEDEAMELRDWQRSSAVYANGVSVSYPTLYPYVARKNVPAIEPVIMEPVLFVGQTLALPITAIDTPPWQDTSYRGVDTPPTYTAVPVVEPDAAGWAPAKWPIPQRRR